MSDRSGPPDLNLNATNWDKFDFTRWNLEGVDLGGFGELAQALFSSPEWRERFAGSLPPIEQAVRGHFEQQAKDLEAASAEGNCNYEKRAVRLKEDRGQLETDLRAALAPPDVAPDPAGFRAGVRVSQKGTGTGIPGLDVRLARGDETLSEGVTDTAGNSILALNAKQLQDPASTRGTVDLEVSLGKQVLQRLQGAVTPKLGQVAVVVVPLDRTTVLDPYITVGARNREVLENALKSNDANLARLKQDQDAAEALIRARLEDVKNILS